MGDSSRKIDLEKIVSYSDDLAQLFKDTKDADNLAHCLQHLRTLQSSGDADSVDLHTSLQVCERKLEECKEKTEAARLEVVSDAELDRLQNELLEELEKERLLLDDLRELTNEINGLDHQRASIEEKKKLMKTLEQYELRQQMTLSMYASVTNIIPNLDDVSNIGGYIVDREKKVVDSFKFDSTEMPAYEACSKIWKMIDNS